MNFNPGQAYMPQQFQQAQQLRTQAQKTATQAVQQATQQTPQAASQYVPQVPRAASQYAANLQQAKMQTMSSNPMNMQTAASSANIGLRKVLITALVIMLVILLFLWSSTCSSNFTAQRSNNTFHTREVQNIAHGEFPLYRGPTRHSVDQIGSGEISAHWDQDVYMARKRSPHKNTKKTQFATDVDFS